MSTFLRAPVHAGSFSSRPATFMSQKLQQTSYIPLLPPIFNAPVEYLIQRFSEPSMMRKFLSTQPGSKLIDEMEEFLRSYPVNSIHSGGRSREDWYEVTRRIYTHINLDWVPHPLSPQEIQWYRNDGKRRLFVIYLLEELRRRLQPQSHKPLEEMIVIARLDYSARFGRLFRINDLPAEILSTIFHFIVWSADTPQQSTRDRLTLTGTCKLWRQLAISDCTLWNTFQYRTDTLGGLSLSRLMVERAGTAPLDIRLADSPQMPMSQETMAWILDHLTPRKSQLRMFIVAVQEWAAGLTLLRWLQGSTTSNMPRNLRRFEIHRLGPPYSQPNANGSVEQPVDNYLLPPVPLFGGECLPTLRWFAISGFHIDWTKSALKYLTTLDIRRVPLDSAPDMDRFRDILFDCPDLSRLVLHGAGPKWRPPAERLPAVTLHNLKSLILADFALAYAQYVVSIIHAPEVTELSLYGFTGEDYTTFFLQIASLFPKVRLLTLVSVEVNPEFETTFALRRWFASMPEVRFLRVGHVGETFWEIFESDPKTDERYRCGTNTIIKDSAHILFPKLTSLDVGATPSTSLCDVLSFRRQAGYGLDKLFVDGSYWQSVHFGQKNLLKQLVSTILFHHDPARQLEEERVLKQ